MQFYILQRYEEIFLKDVYGNHTTKLSYIKIAETEWKNGKKDQRINVDVKAIINANVWKYEMK